jgi:hypothetical protein
VVACGGIDADGTQELVVRVNVAALVAVLGVPHTRGIPHEVLSGRAPLMGRDSESANVMTVREVAALWGISASAAYDAARRGEIPGLFNRGRRLFVWMPEFRKTFPGAGPVQDLR